MINPLEKMSIAIGRIASETRQQGMPGLAHGIERLAGLLDVQAHDAEEQMHDGLCAESALATGLTEACSRLAAAPPPAPAWRLEHVLVLVIGVLLH
jgi:hypothetical protein